jgi:hypothetical protein
MKYVTAILVALMAVVGVTAATVDMGQSMSYSFSGLTAGASYSESGNFQLGTEDALTFGSTLSFGNTGDMNINTEFHVDDNYVGTTISGGNTMIYPGNSEHGATDGGAAGQTNNGNGNGGYDNGHHNAPLIVADFTPTVSIVQNMDYLKVITVPVDPRMRNELSMVGGNMDVMMYGISRTSGVEMGMSAIVDNGDHFSFHGYTTDADFKPIAQGVLSANNFAGTVSIKDKFIFMRSSQFNGAYFMLNSTL